MERPKNRRRFSSTAVLSSRCRKGGIRWTRGLALVFGGTLGMSPTGFETLSPGEPAKPQLMRDALESPSQTRDEVLKGRGMAVGPMSVGRPVLSSVMVCRRPDSYAAEAYCRPLGAVQMVVGAVFTRVSLRETRHSPRVLSP